MALVTQHTFLFNDSVKNNIAYGFDRRAVMDAIIAARAEAHAHDFIMALPEATTPMIGELGVQARRGGRRRQRVAHRPRALLKNAPILVLDEATSALDNESDAWSAASRAG